MAVSGPSAAVKGTTPSERASRPTPGHTIAIRQVVEILQGIERRGIDAAPLLQRAGIAPSLLASPLSRVTQAQYAALIRVLARATRDEFWNLLDAPVALGTFAQACRLMIHANTLGEALRIGLRHYHPALRAFVPRLETGPGAATVKLVGRGPHDAARRYAERTFGFLSFGLACWLVGRRVPLLEVRYPDEAGSTPIADVQRLFDAPVSYGHPHQAWCFETRWLALPIVQTRESLDEFLRDAPARLIVRYRDQSSLTERIRRLLRRHLNVEMPTFEAVSRSLAMTPQTLRRRLRDEGQGYQAIKADLRRDAAVEYLARADLTLVDIAQRLGFSEASTFHRAFKGWTGIAPGEYRLRERTTTGPGAT